MKKKLLFLFFTTQLTCLLYAQSFHNNPFFNGGQHFATIKGYYLNGQVVKTLQLPDSSFIVCGYDLVNITYHIMMLKVDACGTIDSSFGTNGMVYMTFDQRNSGYDFALEPNGKIMVAGSQSDGNGRQYAAVSRFLPNGQPDSSFNGTGTNKILALYGDYYSFNYVLPFNNGKYLCQRGNVMMRFNNDGTADDMFGTNGILLHPLPSFVPWTYTASSVQRSDGKIISVHSAVGFSTYISPLFLCTDTTGKIDSSFGTNGWVADGEIYTGSSDPFHLILQSDDKIVAIQSNGDHNNKLYLTRYHTDGRVDSSYGINGRTFVNYPRYVDAKRFGDDKVLLYTAGGGLPEQFSVIDKNGTVSQPFTINSSTGFVFPAVPGTGENAGQALHFKNETELIISNFRHGSVGSYTTRPVPVIEQSVNTLYTNYTEPGTGYQWWFGGAPIAGATGSSYNASQIGEYTLQLTSLLGCRYQTSYSISEILPVKLLSFTGKRVVPGNQLQWQVDRNGSIYAFQIERSSDSRVFTSIGEVNFETGRQQYSFVDAKPGSNTWYYRLVMIEKDGGRKTSSLVKLDGNKSNLVMSISPNPAKNSITISGLAGHGTIRIISAAGSLLMSQPVNGRVQSLNISKLSAGMYYLEYSADGIIARQPFIKN